MNILVDTSVWSLVLRKNQKSSQEDKIALQLSKIIRDLRLIIIGPIRQEILSGISDKNKFIELKTKISFFKDHRIETKDYELAAELYNSCRSQGIQGSHVDYLICAVSINNKMSIMTLDKDFENYRKIIPIQIEEIE